MSTRDPFPSPFGDEPARTGAAGRLRNSLTTLRRLRTQVGTDGLTPAATRSLLDELVKALEALDELASGGGTE